MASRYGVPAGSSLTDWPITYDDLAPYYEQAEWEIGVSGDGTRAIATRARAPSAYPMPPVPANATTAVLKRGADASA